MSTTHASPRDKAISRWLRVSGLLLWIAVAVVGYGCWRSASETSKNRSTTESQANDNEFKPIPEKAPDESGQQTEVVFDKQGLPLPAWDPKGLPDFEFTDRSGRKVSKADLLGKPWAVCFVFTRCAGPCARVTGQMKLLQDRVKDLDVNIVTITVDPEFDTEAQLNKYAEQFDAKPDNWFFLTGDRKQIYGLIIDDFRMPVQEMFGDDRKPGAEFVHTTNVLLVNAEGKVINKYDAQSDEEMASLFKALKHEAEAAKK